MRAVVPGIGKLSNDCSKPGTGWPGCDPAPLSNRIRIGLSCSNALSACANVGISWIGSGGSVTPEIPIAAW